MRILLAVRESIVWILKLLFVPSGCEGKLGVALESLQGLRDLT